MGNAINSLNSFIYNQIKQTRQNGPGNDILSRITHAKDENTNEGLSLKEIRDNALVFMVAGHETTAVSLSWLFYLISKHIKVQEKMRKEIELIVGNNDPTQENIEQLKYCSAVISESSKL